MKWYEAIGGLSVPFIERWLEIRKENRLTQLRKDLEELGWNPPPSFSQILGGILPSGDRFIREDELKRLDAIFAETP